MPSVLLCGTGESVWFWGEELAVALHSETSTGRGRGSLSSAETRGVAIAPVGWVSLPHQHSSPFTVTSPPPPFFFFTSCPGFWLLRKQR